MKPYEDESMIFDTEDKRYILTKDYVLKKTGIDLTRVLNPAFSSEPQNLANQFLDQISTEMYYFVYAHNQDNDFQEWCLNNMEELRVIIRDAMLQQVLYVLRSGDMFSYCGVNLKSGQVIESEKLVSNAIAPLAKMKLSKKIERIGCAILYQGKFRYPYNYRSRLC